MSVIANIENEVKLGGGAQFWVYLSPQNNTASVVKGWSVKFSQWNWCDTITSENPTKQIQTKGLSGTFDIEVTELDLIYDSHDRIDALVELLIKKEVIEKIIPAELLDENTKYHINPTGRFVIGGPQGDAGLTGRKIIVDTYGGSCPHGGGAFSGKDPTKVDRSAAYAARWVAKNLVASGACDKATIQISYAIGIAKPVSILVDTHSTGIVEEEKTTSAW